MDTGKIKNLIQESNLSAREKFEAEVLLDKATSLEENQSFKEFLEVLENLYKDLGNKNIFLDQDFLAPRYKRALLELMDDLKLRIRKKDYTLNTKFFQLFDNQSPITFRKLLKCLGVTNSGGKFEVPEEILDKKIKVAEDDGMGYSPKGFSEVFSGYLGNDGDIYLWI